LLLGACARSEEASMVPPEGNEGYNRVGQVRTPEQDDREPSIGQWRAALQDERQALEFGPMGTEPLFSLLCAPQGGGVLLQRHGAAPAAGTQQTMLVTIGDVSERFPVSAGVGAIPMQRAEVPPTSRLSGLLTAAAQPIVIQVEDSPPLILPHNPLVADYLPPHRRPTRPRRDKPDWLDRRDAGGRREGDHLDDLRVVKRLRAVDDLHQRLTLLLRRGDLGRGLAEPHQLLRAQPLAPDPRHALRHSRGHPGLLEMIGNTGLDDL
jgi:hypothetical protein